LHPRGWTAGLRWLTPALPSQGRTGRGEPVALESRRGRVREVMTKGGWQFAWLVGLAAVPLTFVLVRRQELARTVAASLGRDAPALVPADWSN
jgi:hypothetical protein